MAKINPRALRFEQKPAAPERNQTSTMGALIKSSINSALSGIFSKPLSVKIDNEAALQTALTQIVSGINEFNKQKKDLQIGKAALTTQKIDSFEVSNLETLTLQNVESLAVAFEQLKPIITALEAGNKLDQQSTAFLRTIISTLEGMNTVLRSLEAKEMQFPVEQITAGLQSLEQSVKALKLEVPATAPQKFPEFPKAISMTEGKALISAVEALTAKVDALPKSYPEVTIPREISVNNFPPQKYPNPVTNININPLRGFGKSTAITVGTSALALPGTPLAYRRSIIIYNNDTTNTMYIGGSGVTTSNGLPIGPGAYSPAIDAGPKLVVYGIAGSSINCRVFEASNENIGA